MLCTSHRSSLIQVSEENHRSSQSDSNGRRKKETPKHSEDTLSRVPHSPVKHNPDPKPGKFEGSKTAKYNDDARKFKASENGQAHSSVMSPSVASSTGVSNSFTALVLNKKESKKKHKHEMKQNEGLKSSSSSTIKPSIDGSAFHNRNRRTNKDLSKIRPVTPISHSSEELQEILGDNFVSDGDEELKPTSSRHKSPVSSLPKSPLPNYNRKLSKRQENSRASFKEQSRLPSRELNSFSEFDSMNSISKPSDLSRHVVQLAKTDLLPEKHFEKEHRRQDSWSSRSENHCPPSDRKFQKEQNGHGRKQNEFIGKIRKPQTATEHKERLQNKQLDRKMHEQKQLELHKEKHMQRESLLQPVRQSVSQQRDQQKLNVHDKGQQQGLKLIKHQEPFTVKKTDPSSHLGKEDRRGCEVAVETQPRREGKDKAKIQRPSNFPATKSSIVESIQRQRQQSQNKQLSLPQESGSVLNKVDKITHVDAALRWRSSFIDFQKSDSLDDTKKTKAFSSPVTPGKSNASPREKFDSLMSPERTPKKKDPMPNLKLFLGKSTTSLMSPLPPTPAALRDDPIACGEKSPQIVRSRLPSGKSSYSTFMPNFDKSGLLSPIPPTPSHLSDANNFVLSSDSKDDRKDVDKCISSSIISQTEVPALMSPFPATPRHLGYRKSVHEADLSVGDLKIPSPVPPSASPNTIYDSDAPVMPVEPSVDSETSMQQFAMPTPMSPLPRTPKRDNAQSSLLHTQKDMPSIFSTPDRENSTATSTVVRFVGTKQLGIKSPIHSSSDKNSKVKHSKNGNPKFSTVDFAERFCIPDNIMSPLPQTPAHLSSTTPVKNPFYSYDLDALKNRNEQEAGGADSCIIPFNIDSSNIVSPIGATPAHLTSEVESCKTFQTLKDSASSPKGDEVSPSSPNSESIALAVASITPTSEESMLQMPQFRVTKVSPEIETKTRSIFSPSAESPYSNCGELNQWETDDSKKTKETSNAPSSVIATVVTSAPQTPSEFSVVIASGNQNNHIEQIENNSSLSRIDELLDSNFMLEAEPPKNMDVEIKSEKSPAPPISSVLSEALASAGLHGSEFDSESLTVLATSPHVEAVGTDDSVLITNQEISGNTCVGSTASVIEVTTASNPLTVLSTSVCSTPAMSFLDAQVQHHPHQNGLEKVELLSNGIQISLPSISLSDGVISGNIPQCLSLPVPETCVSHSPAVQSSSDIPNPSIDLPVTAANFPLNSSESASTPDSRALLSLPTAPDLSNVPTSTIAVLSMQNLPVQNSTNVIVNATNSVVSSQATGFTDSYQLSGPSVSSISTPSTFSSSDTLILPVVSTVISSILPETSVVEPSSSLSLHSDIAPVMEQHSSKNNLSSSASPFKHSSVPSTSICPSPVNPNAVALSSFVMPPSVTPTTISPRYTVSPYTIHQSFSASRSPVGSMQTLPTKQQTPFMVNQSPIPQLSSCVTPPVASISVDPHPLASGIPRSHPILVQFHPSGLSALPESVSHTQTLLNTDDNLPKISQQISCNSGSRVQFGASVQSVNTNGCDTRGVVMNNISVTIPQNSMNTRSVTPEFLLKSTSPQFLPGLSVSVGAPAIGSLGHPLPGFINPLEMNVIRYPESISSTFIATNSQNAKYTPSVSSAIPSMPFEQMAPATHLKTSFLQDALLAPKPDSALNNAINQRKPKVSADAIAYSPLMLNSSMNLNENNMPVDIDSLASHNNALEEFFAPQVSSVDARKSVPPPITTPNVLSSNESGQVPQQTFISCSPNSNGIPSPFTVVSTVPIQNVANSVPTISLQSDELGKSVDINLGISEINTQFQRPPSCTLATISQNNHEGSCSTSEKQVEIPVSCPPDFTFTPVITTSVSVVPSVPNVGCISDEEQKRLEAHRLLLAEKKYMEDKRKAGKGFQSPNENRPLSQLHALLQGHSNHRQNIQSSLRPGLSENMTDISSQQRQAEELNLGTKSSQLLENERFAEQKRRTEEADLLRERAEQEQKRNDEHQKLLEEKEALERQQAEKLEIQRIENEREDQRRREELDKQQKEDQQRRDQKIENEAKQRQRIESEQRMHQEAEHRRLLETRQREALFKSRELNLPACEKPNLRSPLELTGFQGRDSVKQSQDDRGSFKGQTIGDTMPFMIRHDSMDKLPTPVLEQCSPNQGECGTRPLSNMDRKRFEIGKELLKPTYSNSMFETQPFVQPGFPEPLQHANRSWVATHSHSPRPDMHPPGVNKVFEHHAVSQPYQLIGSSMPFRPGTKQPCETFNMRHDLYSVRYPIQRQPNVSGSSTGRHVAPFLGVNCPGLPAVHSSQVRMPSSSNSGNNHNIRRLLRGSMIGSQQRDATPYQTSKVPANTCLPPGVGREIMPQTGFTNMCSVNAPTTWKDPSHYKKSLINFRHTDNFPVISNHSSVPVHSMVTNFNPLKRGEISRSIKTPLPFPADMNSIGTSSGKMNVLAESNINKKSVSCSPDTNTQTSPLSLVMGTKQFSTPNVPSEMNLGMYSSLKPSENSTELASEFPRHDLYTRISHLGPPAEVRQPFNRHLVQTDKTLSPRNESSSSANFIPNSSIPYEGSGSNRRQSVNDACLFMDNINKELGCEKYNRVNSVKSDHSSNSGSNLSSSSLPNQSEKPGSLSDNNGNTPVVISCPPSSSWLQFSGVTDKQVLNDRESSSFTSDYLPVCRNFNKSVSPDDSPINVVDDAPDPLFPNPACNIPSLNPLVSPKLKENPRKNIYLEGLGKKVASQLTHAKLDNSESLSTLVSSIPDKNLGDGVLGPVVSEGLLGLSGHPEESSRLRKFLKRYQRGSVDQPRSESQSSFCPDTTPFQENFGYFKSLEDLGNQDRHDFSVTTFDSSHLNLENETISSQSTHSQPTSASISTHIQNESSKPASSSANSYENDQNNVRMVANDVGLMNSLSGYQNERNISNHLIMESSINSMPGTNEEILPDAPVSETVLEVTKASENDTVSNIPETATNQLSVLPSNTSNSDVKISSHDDESYTVSNQNLLSSFKPDVHLKKHLEQDATTSTSSEVSAINSTISSASPFAKSCLAHEQSSNNSAPESFPVSLIDSGFLCDTRDTDRPTAIQTEVAKEISSEDQANLEKDSCLGSLSLMLPKDVILSHDDSDVDSSCTLKVSRILGRRRHSTSSHSSKSLGGDSRPASPTASQASLSPKEIEDTDRCISEPQDAEKSSDSPTHNIGDEETSQLLDLNGRLPGSSACVTGEIQESVIPSSEDLRIHSPSFNDLHSKRAENIPPDVSAIPSTIGSDIDSEIENTSLLKTIEVSSIKETEIETIQTQSLQFDPAVPESTEQEETEIIGGCTTSKCDNISSSLESGNMETNSCSPFQRNELKMTLKTPTKASIKEFPEDLLIVSSKTNTVHNKRKLKNSNAKARKPRKSDTSVTRKVTVSSLTPRTTRSTRGAAKISYAEFFDNEPATPAGPPPYVVAQKPTSDSLVFDQSSGLPAGSLTSSAKKKRGRPKKNSVKVVPLVADISQAVTSTAIASAEPLIAAECAREDGNSTDLAKVSTAACTLIQSKDVDSTPNLADDGFKLPVHRPLKMTIKRTLSGSRVKYSSTSDEPSVKKQKISGGLVVSSINKDLHGIDQPIFPTNPRDPLGINDTDDYSFCGVNQDHFDTDIENMSVADRLRKAKKSNKHHLQMSRKLVKRSIRTPAHDPNYSYLNTPSATPSHFSSAYGSCTPIYTPLHRISYDGPGSTPLRIQGGDLKIHLVNKNKIQPVRKTKPIPVPGRVSKKSRKSPKKKKKHTVQIGLDEVLSIDGPTSASPSEDILRLKDCSQSSIQNASQQGCTSNELPNAACSTSNKDSNLSAQKTSNSLKEKIILKIPKNLLHAKLPDSTNPPHLCSTSSETNSVPVPELSPGKVAPLIIKKDRVQALLVATSSEKVNEAPSYYTLSQELLKQPHETTKIIEPSVDCQRSVAVPDEAEPIIPQSSSSIVGVQRKVSLPLKAELKNQRASMRQSASLGLSGNTCTSEPSVDKTIEANRTIVVQTPSSGDGINSAPQVVINEDLNSSKKPDESISPKETTLSSTSGSNMTSVDVETPFVSNTSCSSLSRPIDAIEKELAAIVGDTYMTPRRDLLSPNSTVSILKSSISQPTKEPALDMECLEMSLAAIDGSPIHKKQENMCRRINTLEAILLDERAEKLSSLQYSDDLCTENSLSSEMPAEAIATVNKSSSQNKGSPIAAEFPLSSGNAADEDLTHTAENIGFELAQSVSTVSMPDAKLHKDPKVLVQNLSSNEINSLQNHFLVTPEIEPKKLPRSPPKLRNKKHAYHGVEISSKDSSPRTFSKKIFPESGGESVVRSSCPGKIRKIMAERERQRTLKSSETYEFCDEIDSSPSCDSSNTPEIVYKGIGLTPTKAKLSNRKKVIKRASKLSSTASAKTTTRRKKRYVASTSKINLSVPSDSVHECLKSSNGNLDLNPSDSQDMGQLSTSPKLVPQPTKRRLVHATESSKKRKCDNEKNTSVLKSCKLKLVSKNAESKSKNKFPKHGESDLNSDLQNTNSQTDLISPCDGESAGQDFIMSCRTVSNNSSSELSKEITDEVKINGRTPSNSLKMSGELIQETCGTAHPTNNRTNGKTSAGFIQKNSREGGTLGNNNSVESEEHPRSEAVEINPPTNSDSDKVSKGQNPKENSKTDNQDYSKSDEVKEAQSPRENEETDTRGNTDNANKSAVQITRKTREIDDAQAKDSGDLSELRKNSISQAIRCSNLEMSEGLTQKETSVRREAGSSTVGDTASASTRGSRSPNSPRWTFPLGDSIDENAADYKDTLFVMSYLTPRTDCGDNAFLPASASLVCRVSPGQTPNYSSSSPSSPMLDADRDSSHSASDNARCQTSLADGNKFHFSNQFGAYRCCETRKEAEVKLSEIPLSNDTISDRMEDMSKEILAHVVADLISSSAKFSLQLDEITDVSNLSQLAVFMRYTNDDLIEEYFLFCKPLATTTKAADVKKLVDNFFKDNSLSWDMVSAVCSDRASVMLGRKSGFGVLVKADAPHIIVTHCILRRHALATKTLPPKLTDVLKIVVESVNYMRTSALRLFSELCKEMGSEFEVLLYHSNIRWLSRGQLLNRIFAMRVELALFLQEHKHCHADCFKIFEFIRILAYLADIFATLNHLHQKM
ncbi:protein of unknown function DUF4371 [Trinorchestia longiramus]|nr:protein of unknown function DUF4371 [Trinorchestia longiramus]